MSKPQPALKYFALSDIGKKYTHLEDAYVLPVPNEKYNVPNPDTTKYGHLFVLADGVGGAQAGDVAAELAANWVFKDYYQSAKHNNPLPERIPGIIQNVNTRIVRLAEEHPEYKGMCTTMVVTLMLEGFAYFFSVGVSRVYRFRQDKLYQLTEDQSEVWTLYRSGAITKDEIRTHPRRNIVTQAVGIHGELAINQNSEKIQPGDLFLMCSDGLTDMVPEAEIVSVLQSDTTLEIMAKQLVARANYLGGRDNITVILIRSGNYTLSHWRQAFRHNIDAAKVKLRRKK